MQSILKITAVFALSLLAACSASQPQQHATFMPAMPGASTDEMLTTPQINPPPQAQQPVSTAQAPAPATNTVPPPSGVMMPAASPPVPAYGNGDPSAPRTPYFYPPVGMGVHVPN